jgi:hypothetical protein
MSTRRSERKQVDPGAAESVNAGRPGGSNPGNAAGQSQHRRLHVPMHSKRATRRHAVPAALAPRLKGLNITTDLMQVGKIVTGEQLYHHGQGLRAALIVLPAPLQVIW